MRIGIIALGVVMAACAGAAEGTPDDDAAAPSPSAAQPTTTPPATAQPAACTAAQSGTAEVCTMASGGSGARLCQWDTLVWTDCLSTKLCQPGDTRSCSSPYGAGEDICTVMNGQWAFTTSGCNTPLVLSFDSAAVTFTNPRGSFDVAGRETVVNTNWVGSTTPWLVFDRNANGKIDDGSELFGSMSRLPDGRRAKHGFAALALLDSDGDGWITARDSAFSRLALWRDINQDRASSPDELSPLGDAVVALSLAYTDAPRCFAGNCERERAEFVFVDGAGNERHGSVVDVYLAEP